ncbi:Peptidyl-prolyl cis-trans isomerase cyp6 [Diplonema papillatum]|nr:Peptidyl-prolyl cis-trans isomerase cyp6 [Diplonema papillatum]
MSSLHGRRMLVAAAGLAVGCKGAWVAAGCFELPSFGGRTAAAAAHEAAYQPPYPVNPDNSRVFFDVAADGELLGRVEFEVFDDDSPSLAANFKALSLGYMYGLPVRTKHPTKNRKHGDAKQLTYKNTMFHSVEPGYIIQGGDNQLYNGKGGESYTGKIILDCFRGKGGRIVGPGCLCTVNHGRNTNKSQFFVSLRAIPHLNGRNSVFGQVVSGWDVVCRMEELGTSSGKPRQQLSVAACGILKQKSGLLYDSEDPFSVPPSEDWRQKGAANLGNIAAEPINMAENSLFNTDWIAPTWLFDMRGGDGTGAANRSVSELSADPSMTGC